MSERRLGRSKYTLASAFLLVVLCLLLVPNPQPLAMGQGSGVQITITMTGGREEGPPTGGGDWGRRCPAGETPTVGKVTATGVATQSIVVESFDKRVCLTIDTGTTALTSYGTPLRCIGIHKMTNSASPPEGARIIGVMYDVVPDGATFTPVATLEYSYDPNDIPEGIAEESLVIACYDEASGEWTELDSVVDTEANTVTAKISRFNDLAVLGYEPAAPAAFEIGSLSISPTEVDIGETVNITVLVANTGSEAGNYKVILKINGVVEAGKDVALNPDASKQVSFSTSKNTAGTYSVAVNGLIGSFIVKQKPPVPAKPVNWPVVGGIAAVIVGLLVFFWIRRRAY